MKKSDDFQAAVRITASGHDPKSMLMQLKEKLAEEAGSLRSIGWVIFFCSGNIKPNHLADFWGDDFWDTHMNTRDTHIIGMVSSSQIGEGGYLDDGCCNIVAVLFAGEHFDVELGVLGELDRFELNDGYEFGRSVRGRLDERSRRRNQFGILLLNGAMTQKEECVVQAIQAGVGEGMTLMGGTAKADSSDALYYQVGSELVNDNDAAILVLCSTDLPVYCFSDHHFSAHQRQMVVTESVVHERTLKEIDGLPAAEILSRYLNSRWREIAAY